MADFRLSLQADTDLAGIAKYTIETFGIEQARRYVQQRILKNKIK